MKIDEQSIRVICRELSVCPHDIHNVTALKKGMTNRSFSFSTGGKKYIIRVPGEGTKELINRSYESSVYEALKDSGICDRIVCIDADTGYKISEYMENSRVCDPNKQEDVKRCMKKLREFHELNLTVSHIFDMRHQIEFYERLFGGGNKSCHNDYSIVKRNVFELYGYIDNAKKCWTLCHIDSVPDNFLFTEDGGIRLIDWEYAGMQDADVDIAMFAVYSFYDRSKIEQLIDSYYGEGCPHDRRLKIYCYIAICGLLWSNWCEYKQLMGIEFGEYARRQYEYAVEYYKVFQEEAARK